MAVYSPGKDSFKFHNHNFSCCEMPGEQDRNTIIISFYLVKKPFVGDRSLYREFIDQRLPWMEKSMVIWLES